MTVVSLFSGAGGLDLGFVQAGHKSDAIPSCDVVIGGFPCQGFSVANTKRHAADTRNILYLQLLRVIRDKKPACFVAENVKGLLNFEKGSVFKRILTDFAAAGYRVSHRLFNAADFGVPQRRERIIIVGVRNDLKYDYEFPLPTHDKDGLGGLIPWVGVGAALSGLPDPDRVNDLPNHVYSKYKLNFNGYIGHRPLDPAKPAPTVTARGDDKGGVVILPHPNASRRMTGRELATVQGFPLQFAFSGRLSSVYRQIGNAVPPMLARAVAAQFPLRCPR